MASGSDNANFVILCSMCGSSSVKPFAGSSYAFFDRFGVTTMGGFYSCENCQQVMLPIKVEAKSAGKVSAGIRKNYETKNGNINKR